MFAPSAIRSLPVSRNSLTAADVSRSSRTNTTFREKTFRGGAVCFALQCSFFILILQLKAFFVYHIYRKEDIMELKTFEYDLSICKVESISGIDTESGFYFIGQTDEELSLVCRTEEVPEVTIERDDGWKAFRIQGVLDFSLIGILSEISTVLAENGIGIFVISTYNTDYVLVKKENFDKAIELLSSAGYDVL
jgi:hypothetical protein